MAAPLGLDHSAQLPEAQCGSIAKFPALTEGDSEMLVKSMSSYPHSIVYYIMHLPTLRHASLIPNHLRNRLHQADAHNHEAKHHTGDRRCRLPTPRA